MYLWRTSDGAANWTRSSQVLNTAVSAIAVAPSDSNYVAAGTGDGELLVTTAGTTADANTVWSSAKPRFGNVSWMAFDPVNKNTVYATISTYGGKHIWKSTNLGVTWTSIDGSGSTGLPDTPVHCIVIDPANTQRLFIGTDVGVFVSLDGGATWASENAGFANVIVETLVLNNYNGISTLYRVHSRAWRVACGGWRLHLFDFSQ